MDWEDIRARLKRIDPQVADIAIALLLTLTSWVQIWAVTNMRPQRFIGGPGPDIRIFVERADFGVMPYILAACVFLPLAWRRSIPWLALLVAGISAAAYQLAPLPRTFTVLGPMIALYSLAAWGHKRYMSLVALAITSLVVAIPAFAFSLGVRWVADAVGAFTLLAGATLLGDTARSRREYIAEVEARALEAERTREEEALRRVEEERLRIAREVHDIVAHSLSIVTVQAAAAEAVIDRDPAQARESLGAIRTTGREALAELRSMLDLMRTGEAQAPLAPSADLTNLEQLVAPVRDSGLEVELRTSGDLAAIPAFASVSAYRIVQEALTNAVRHSGARRVIVSADARPQQLELEIDDDGNGLPQDALDRGGHGVRGMRERVEALGGEFALGTSPDGGVRVSTTIPLTRSAP